MTRNKKFFLFICGFGLGFLVLQDSSRDQGNAWSGWPNHLTEEASRALASQFLQSSPLNVVHS